MTNMPEAKLAREAEMCYATVAMVTDYDCWHADHDHVTVDQVIGTLLSNAEKAKNLVAATAPRLTGRTALCGAGCHPGGGVTALPGRNAAKRILEREAAR